MKDLEDSMKLALEPLNLVSPSGWGGIAQLVGLTLVWVFGQQGNADISYLYKTGRRNNLTGFRLDERHLFFKLHSLFCQYFRVILIFTDARNELLE